MKLPFDFATKLLLRLVLPGALLAATFWPLLLCAKNALGLTVSEIALTPFAILMFGWIMLLLDMPLYMIAEGRRLWPTWLVEFGLRAQAKRLKALQLRRTQAPAGPQRNEIDLEIRKYPLDERGEPVALMPTRLGNLIYASELYPDRKYGIDGSFGWYRLWISVDKDLRAELDDQQALVDGSLYGAFIAVVASVACLSYAGIRFATGNEIVSSLPGPWTLLTLFPICLAASALLYSACLSAQTHYGELFCALFDQNIDKLAFTGLLSALAASQNDPALLLAAPQERARAAIRFLKWHRYRRIGQTNNEIVRS